METHGVTDAHGADAHAAPHVAPNYMKIWLYLFVLTVVEVLIAFVSGLPDAILLILLLALAVWKALLVALYYMHLKFEPRKLWWIVMAPLPLVAILIGVVLLESW
jgi:cytochrome c oxidase subunit IV